MNTTGGMVPIMASSKTQKHVPFLDLARESKAEKAKLMRAFSEFLDSGKHILGNQVVEFEREWSQATRSKHTIGVGNGMDAISIALLASGIPRGGEIITSPLTAAASVLGVLRAGFVPVLADVDLATGLLDITSVQNLISRKTVGILLVHLYGQLRDTARWADICRSQNLILLEDSAQSHLASENGNTAGSIGLAGAFSFYPTKNLGSLGDAGAVTTNSDEIASMARKIRNYGQSDTYVHDVEGLNSRLDEIQAGVLRVKLQSLTSKTFARQEIARRYHDEITNPRISLLSRPVERSAHVYHLYVIRSDKRDELRNYLTSRGIGTLVHYPIPLHKQRVFKTLNVQEPGLPNAEKMAAEVLSLPCNPSLSEEDISYVIDEINSWNPG